MPEKQCKRCKIIKPLTEFAKAKGCKDGTRHECKKCLSELSLLSQSTRSEQRKIYMKEYRIKNREKWNRNNEQQKKVNADKRKKYAENEEYRNSIKAKSKAYFDKNPMHKKRQRLKKYGISIDEFNTLFELQGGKCAICGYSDLTKSNFFPMVDHCHDKGHVRGILCSDCNFGLGKFKDNAQLLLNAINYLEVNKL
jgi:hypothetical protein